MNNFSLTLWTVRKGNSAPSEAEALSVNHGLRVKRGVGAQPRARACYRETLSAAC